MKKYKFVIFVFFSLFSSCSSYISKIYKQLDKAEKIQHAKKTDVFAQYRKNEEPRKKATNTPLSTRETSQLKPQIKRLYKKKSLLKKRFTADDLNDNANNSLWVGEGKDSDFFIEIKKKKNGDIIIANILPIFRNQITRELKKAFPKRKKVAANLKNKEENKKPEEEKEENKNETETSSDDVIDQVSTVVTEQINKTHLLIRGRKIILFRKRKRLIEIQALVARTDITPEDKISSDKFVESKVRVIR